MGVSTCSECYTNIWLITCHHFLSLLHEHVWVLSHQYDSNTPNSLSEFSINFMYRLNWYHINNLDSYCSNHRLRAFCKVATVMVKEYSQVPTVYSSINCWNQDVLQEEQLRVTWWLLNQISYQQNYKGEQPCSTLVSTIADKTTMVLKFTTIPQIACSCVVCIQHDNVWEHCWTPNWEWPWGTV